MMESFSETHNNTTTINGGSLLPTTENEDGTLQIEDLL